LTPTSPGGYAAGAGFKKDGDAKGHDTFDNLVDGDARDPFRMGWII